MISPPLLATLTLLPLALAAPTPASQTPAAPTPTPCKAKIEQLPWHLTNLTIFTSSHNTNSSSTPGSSLSFHFCDTNDRLQLDTTCTRTLAAGSALVDAETYYPCEGGDVRFIYAGAWVGVERGFEDDCLGPYPYNSAIAYGQANTSLVESTSVEGVMLTQAVVVVHITKES
ncbi:hypothetical protein LTR08_001684 [Meristemomyces frigidus]|nr:hypothetical protein LTR08_001684 [Meristemomyces frigidus]